jgi:hypothetical protein
MKKFAVLGGTAAVLACASLALASQDPQEASAPSPEAKARMEPGPMHQKLEALVGEFEMQGRWRMSPDAPWQELTADVHREWILDGRFVEEKIDSEFMGEEFHGIGIVGYDNTREEFTMVWVENMSTGTWFTTGKLQGTNLVFEGENSDCMTGEKDRWGKSSVDLATGQYQGWSRDASGKEFVSMEMTSEKK